MEQETKKCPYCGEEILAIAKKCKYCGEWLTEEKAGATPKSMIPCPICSEMIEEGMETCPHCHEKLTKTSSPAPTFTKPIKAEKKEDNTRSFFDYYLWDPFFRHYFDFKGRLNRKHYWISMLIWTIVLIALFVPAGILFFLISIIPLYATAARRMRDGDSVPGLIGWLSLFFPTVLWWLMKPTEYRIEGMEDAKPDIPQAVKFKRSDVITTLILITFFIFGLALNFGLLDRVPTKEDNSELISTVTIEDDTDNDILKIGEALEILNYVEEYEEVSNEAKSKIRELLIEQYQYERGADEFQRQYGDIWVFYKNCVQKGEGSPIPIDTNVASVVRLGVDDVSTPSVEITVFDKQQLDSLKQQFLKNDFTLTRIEDYGEIYEKDYYSAQVSWFDEDGLVLITKEKME